MLSECMLRMEGDMAALRNGSWWNILLFTKPDRMVAEVLAGTLEAQKYVKSEHE